jgi:hypothetical protein
MQLYRQRGRGRAGYARGLVSARHSFARNRDAGRRSRNAFRREADATVELGITMSPAHQGPRLGAEARRPELGFVFETLENIV